MPAETLLRAFLMPALYCSFVVDSEHHDMWDGTIHHSCQAGSVALHTEYCRQRRPYARDRKSNPPFSCSLDLAKPRGSMPCSPFYTAHEQPLSTCSAVPKAWGQRDRYLLGTYAAQLRMLVRSYAWMFLVVCAGGAVSGQNAMCYESPFAAVCCACTASSGRLDRMMCPSLMYAAVRCASAVTSGWLAMIMCRALIDAAVCCASAATSGAP